MNCGWLLYLSWIWILCANLTGAQRDDDCSIKLVESIPENVTYPDSNVQFNSTYDVWMTLIQSAQKSISIGSFYWSMLGSTVVNRSIPASKQGETVFASLLAAGSRGISLQIVNNGVGPKDPELNLLQDKGRADVRWINFPELGLSGILHTKLWLVDGRHAYVGSANMDFRSLTEVKELGLWMNNCPLLNEDLNRIFQVYWALATPDAKVPQTWPPPFNALTNQSNPFNYNDNSNIVVSSSPPLFSTNYRSNDINTLVEVINKATQFVYVAVMDYAPLIVVYDHKGHNQFWPVIDNALREAAVIRKVHVCLLMSHWNHTSRDMRGYLMSLQSLSLIPGVRLDVKLFEIPAYTPEQRSIPYSRVNHNKYMVTDKHVYIGTSNWSGDYFTNTGGISVTASPYSQQGRSALRDQSEALFLRDWNSKYAGNLTDHRGF